MYIIGQTELPKLVSISMTKLKIKGASKSLKFSTVCYLGDEPIFFEDK